MKDKLQIFLSILVTHCTPPEIPVSYNLKIATSDLTAVGDANALQCMNGMKFNEDFELDEVEIVCDDDNQWILPNDTWPKCVSSRKCY